MFVPNSTLSVAAVINFSSRMYRRIEWTIRLEYRTSSNQLRYITQEIKRYLFENENFVKPPESISQVRLDKFGENSIELLIYCFTNTNVWAEWLKIKEDFIIKIKEIVERAGAGFALPSNSIYVEQVEHNLKKRELPKELMDTLYKDEKRDRNVVDVMDGDF